MNSWQSSVPGEPSLGKPHYHYAQVLSVDPVGTAVTAVDLSAEVPVGTTMVKGWGTVTGATTGKSAFIYDKTGTDIISRGLTLIAAGTIPFSWTATLDSARNMYYSASNSDITDIKLYMVEYYM